MSLYTSMSAVMQSAYAQSVNIIGDRLITYKISNSSSQNTYGEPIITYSASLITAIVQPLDQKDVMFREPGFKADDHCKIFLHNIKISFGGVFNIDNFDNAFDVNRFPSSSVIPKHLDHYIWNSIEFEVRHVMPRLFNDNVIYYEVIGNRFSGP